MMLVLLLLLFGASAAYDRPATVNIGLLYPLVKDSDGSLVIDNGGKKRLLGALPVCPTCHT